MLPRGPLTSDAIPNNDISGTTGESPAKKRKTTRSNVKNLTKNDPLAGYNVRYTGRKFSSEPITPEEKVPGLDKLRSDFSEIGALVIRFHLGHGQRLGLLQQICRDDYTANPIERPGIGNSQEDLFAVDIKASASRRVTRALEEYSHYSLGRGKVLNERAQPLVHVNENGIRGEQGLWDVIHSPVWSTGINLALQLHKQGFVYLVHPLDMQTEDYAKISQELAEGLFEVSATKPALVIQTHSGRLLNTAALNTIKIDIEPASTIQNNGMLISADNQSAPLGWLLHQDQMRTLEQTITENLFRIIRIAKGGFYELSKEQQTCLQAGLLKNNGLGLFSQNQVFNAMHIVFEPLEQECQFDPSALLKNFAFRTSYNRAQKLMQETEVVEDFLTGALVTEMVQHLRVTQPNSVRTKLPLRFTHPFRITQNNAKAIAYAYDMKTVEGKSVLEMHKDQSHITEPTGPLIDYGINGDLINPALNNPKHIACLLSTAILVSEQMILEQLLRDACRHGDDHPNVSAFKTIIKNNGIKNGDSIYNELIALARTLPSNENGPILGLQFTYCEPLTDKLRAALGFSCELSFSEKCFGSSRRGLTEIVAELYHANEKTRERLLARYSADQHLAKYLKNLFETAKLLQGLNGISVREEQSRGINAGLILVIEKLSPALYAELVVSGELASALALTSEQPVRSSHREIQHALTAGGEADSCPFLRAMRPHHSVGVLDINHASATERGLPAATQTSYLQNTQPNSWSRFFKRVLPVIALGAATATTPYLNQIFRSKSNNS